MNYVIVTPAYNEEKYIGLTIEGVISQRLLPKKWIIVDDGSTDSTPDIIKRYEEQYPWIQYCRRAKKPGQSYYASNVYAIKEGVQRLDAAAYDYLAILDADISLPPDYYENIGKIFLDNPDLGICSGNCADLIDGKLKKHLYDRRSCAKAIMVFRRKCFEEIGGFVPMKYGGEDTVACFAARMQGWKTWAFHELLVTHNKPLGTGPSKNLLKIRFRQGKGEYFLGSHPLFVLAKSARRSLKESPYLIGGLVRLAGFVSAHFTREKRQISMELIHFIREEQLFRVLKGNKVPFEIHLDTSL